MPIQARKTRFAPSPTGFLHRGHIWSALHVWALASLTNAKVHLRIEDHDQSRCREAHVDAIKADLEWLGFEWDTESRQSERTHIYQNALEKLSRQAHIYPCTCSRSIMTAEGIVSSTGETIYSGRCLNQPADGNKTLALRINWPSESQIAWRDLRCGDFIENPVEQCGDMLLRDSQGQWTYQFAVVVDDIDEDIDLIVRGEDLLASSARQILLGRMLGRTHVPLFFHHSLICDAHGRKLSKREQAASIHAEKMAGVAPTLLLGEVCQAGGLLTTVRHLDLTEALSLMKKRLSSD